MRKRIYRISEDKFDDPKPNIEIAESPISEEFYEGAAFKGVFSVTSVNGVAAPSMVYSDNPYINLLTPQFDTAVAGINYEIANHHFHAGDVLTGHFTILTYGSEIQVPYTFTCVKRPVESGSRTFTSLEEFAKLAQINLPEAQKIFYSDDFYRFIETQPLNTQLLYKGYRGGLASPISLDEFLVALNLKERMTFDISEKNVTYYEVEGNYKAEVEINRSSWGFIGIKVTTDSDIVSVEREMITADYFLGSVFTMNYYIHGANMHEGINYATIYFDYGNIHKELKITATKMAEDVRLISPAHDEDVIKLKLCRLYEQYRLRNITTGEWCDSSIELLDSLMTENEEDEYNNNQLLLYKALMYLANKQRQEALWIITDLKRTIPDKGGPQWAFLLYLCTLIEPEETYVNRLTEDIEMIYRNNSDELSIFWSLLFLREDYLKNPTAKLRAIMAWVMDGFDSPFLYIEAYYIYLQDPYLISQFDDFTVKILNWARKRGAITKDMALALVHVLEQEKNFNNRIYGIIDGAYEANPDMHLLLAIVTYLLKCGCIGKEFFIWYKRAVEANLHVTGLFEAYINSCDLESTDPIPPIVTMFFKYNNTLSYDRLAYLYANIILNEKNDPDTYKQYEQSIEKFSLEQMKLGHIDDNLAVCYQKLLEIGIIDGTVAKIIAQFAFMKKVAPFVSGIRRIICYHEAYHNPIISAVEDGVAYIDIPDGKCHIFMETLEGTIIGTEDGYAITDVLDVTEHFVRLINESRGDIRFIVSDFATRGDNLKLKSEDVEAIQIFINAPEIAPDFKRKYYKEFIEFLSQKGREEVIMGHLLAKADYSLMSSDLIAAVCEVFIANDRLEEIYKLITTNNGLNVHRDTLRRVCDYIIVKSEYESNDFLILMSAFLLNHNLATANMVTYLTRTYLGPTDTMMKIFEKGLENNTDMALFAERLLVQVLYRDQLCEGIQSVFELYYQRKNNKMIVEAYLTFVAHRYLNSNDPVNDRAMAYVFERYLKGIELNESMKIALMKYLCLQGELEDREKRVLDELMGSSILKNQYFGFYSQCDHELRVKYHLYDKFFVEYKGEHKASVYITYSMDGREPETEELIEMYNGLFVKQFVLFYGDKLNVKITDDKGEVLDTQEISLADTSFDGLYSRFAQLNEMGRMLIYKENEQVAKALVDYQGMDYVTDQLFTII